MPQPSRFISGSRLVCSGLALALLCASCGSALAQKPAQIQKAPLASEAAGQDVEDLLREMLEDASDTSRPAPRADLSLAELRQLFDAQDAAWRFLPSAKRGAAIEAAAQIASDVAWKYLDAGDLDSSAAWFRRRSELRLEAYQARTGSINARIRRADAALGTLGPQIEAAWTDLRRFPDLSALILKRIRQAALPARPIAHASVVGLQNILRAQQNVERAQMSRATAAKKADEVKNRASRFGALTSLHIGLSQADTLRSMRWTLSMQRSNAARDLDRASDLLLFAEQDLAARRAEFKRASEVGEALIGHKVRLAVALEDAARARGSLRQTQTALAELDEAIALRRSLPREHAEASLASPFQRLGRLHADLGQTRLARSFFERAVAEAERAHTAVQARTSALPAASPQRVADRTVSASSAGLALNNLAATTHESGDYAQALALYDRARARYEEMSQDNTFSPTRRLLLSTTRANRAAAIYDAGRTEEAVAEFEAVARERRQAGDDKAAALALLHTSDFEYRAGQLDKARARLQQARVLLVASQYLPGLVASTNFLARLEREAGNLDTSEKLNGEALRIAQALGDISWVASARRAQARLQLARLQPQHALQVLAQARELDQKVGAPLKSASTLELEGDALRLQIPVQPKADDATRQSAITKYKAAIELIESVRVSTDESAFAEQEDSYRPYQSLAELLIQAGRTEEAFDYLQRARSKKMRDLLRLDAIKTGDAALQVLVDRLQDREDKLRTAQADLSKEQAQRPAEQDGGKVKALKQLVASTQGEFRRLQYELRQKNPNFDRVLSIDPTLLKDAQGSIPADVALVQYAPLGEKLYIFVVTRDSLKVYSPPVQARDMDARIREFRGLMDQARQKFQSGESLSIEDWSTQQSVAPLRENITALYAMLIEPIQDEIKDKATVAFVPTQLLYYLPLHALARRTDRGLRFLVQDKRIAYLSSARVFVRAGADESDAGEAGAGMMALGNPKGADLPFSGEEANKVAQVFRSAQMPASVVSGDQATKAALLSPANRERRVWHLATHGFLNQADPMRSYIQLAPAASAPKGDASGAKLTLEEVWGLDLKRVDLVTLSACQTALGERNPDGKEVTSLASSFSDAGAKSVLASLWSVADDSTSDLMTSFYRSLASGKPKAQSLQDAELALLAQPETAHPFFWAPFVLMGDWR